MKLTSILLSLVSLAAISNAQTTGVAGVNDLTVNALGAGSTSCNFESMFGGGTFDLNIDTAPGLPTVYLLTPFCRCTDGSVSIAPPPFALPPSPGCGIPYTAGSGTTNQSIDLILGGCGPIIAVPVTADAAGQAFLALPLPAFFSVSVQGVVLHPCATGFPVIFTQAWSLTT